MPSCGRGAKNDDGLTRPYCGGARYRKPSCEPSDAERNGGGRIERGRQIYNVRDVDDGSVGVRSMGQNRSLYPHLAPVEIDDCLAAQNSRVRTAIRLAGCHSNIHRVETGGQDGDASLLRLELIGRGNFKQPWIGIGTDQGEGTHIVSRLLPYRIMVLPSDKVRRSDLPPKAC
ncbi:MAG: hypothetical protein AB7L13_22755 [Acidimicrobiia bacterium]